MLGRFDPKAPILHVTRHEGRTVEQLLSPQLPGELGPRVGGVMLEGSYLQGDPPLVVHLRDSRTPWATDLQAIRFASPGYLGVPAIRELPYAPERPLKESGDDVPGENMARGAMEFQAAHEPAMYVAPTLPITRVSQRFSQHTDASCMRPRT